MSRKRAETQAAPEQADGCLSYGYTPGEYRKFRRYAWRYLLLFSFLYCTLYCTRLSLSNAGAVLMRELGYSKTDVGVLTATLFWAYGFGQLVNGRLCDMTEPGKFIMLSTLLSCACNLLICTQSTLLPMAVIWGVNGFAQSMAWAPGIALLTRWWPGDTRGFATGFALAFSGFGQMIATLSVALALNRFPALGWRGAFLVPTVFPLVMLAVYLALARLSPGRVGLRDYVEESHREREQEAELAAEGRHGVFYAYHYVLSNHSFLIWMLIIFLAGLVRHGLSTWVPLYFIDAYGIDITDGLLRSLTLPLGMGLGTIIVPWLTDRFCPDNRLVAVTFSAVAAAAAVALFVVLNPLARGQMLLIQLLLFVAGFCIYAISGTSGAFATDIGGRVFSGTATGILSFSAYMGAAVQSLVYGFLLDKAGWVPVFVSVSAFCALIGVLALAHTRRARHH